MGVTEKIKARGTLPPNRDPESKNNDSVSQITNALSRGILESVKTKGAQGQRIEEIIAAMTVKDINDLLFDDDVPEALGKRYYFIIEEFLSSSSSYTEDFPLLLMDIHPLLAYFKSASNSCSYMEKHMRAIKTTEQVRLPISRPA